MSLRKIFFIVVAADVVLATLAYFIIFYNTPGTYEVANSPLLTSSVPLASSTIALASTSQSSTIPTSTSTVLGGLPNGNPAQSIYASTYSIPYPLTWPESGATISIMGASLQGNQLTFELAVTMGNAPQCVPLNLRMLVDEQGDLASPATTQFTFPVSGACGGEPGATYTDQQAVFTVDPTTLPIFFTTGGASSIFFQVSTTTSGGLDVSVPQKNG